MPTTGTIDCQAAAFIYKNDATATIAWQVLQVIGSIRRELHDTPAPFTSGLQAWNTNPGRDPTNAFLAIYAHMGQPGVGPGNGAGNVVSWATLAQALPQGVETLWLIGCDSDEVLKQWPGLGGPVRGYLLVTESSELWLPLLPLFAAEISLNQIRPYDQMPEYIARTLAAFGLGALAGSIQYYRPTANGWTRFP